MTTQHDGEARHVIRVRVRWGAWPGGTHRCIQARPPAGAPDLDDLGDAMWLADERGQVTLMALWRPGLPRRRGGCHR